MGIHKCFAAREILAVFQIIKKEQRNYKMENLTMNQQPQQLPKITEVFNEANEQPDNIFTY